MDNTDYAKIALVEPMFLASIVYGSPGDELDHDCFIETIFPRHIYIYIDLL